MSRRRNRGRQAPAPIAAPIAPIVQLPALSAPVVIDKSRAKGKHLRLLAELAAIRTEAQLTARIGDIYDLVNAMVVGGMDERPASDFWPAFVELRKQLEGNQGN
jgi:hypothetical protein